LADKFQEKISYEIGQIDKLLNEAEPLLDLCRLREPDFIELSAADLPILFHFFEE
jgi:hypothetical protein